jgi:hypothetical protein
MHDPRCSCRHRRTVPRDFRLEPGEPDPCGHVLQLKDISVFIGFFLDSKSDISVRQIGPTTPTNTCLAQGVGIADGNHDSGADA